jgi:hypothetical protein
MRDPLPQVTAVAKLSARRRHLWILCSGVLFVLFPLCLRAQSRNPTDYDVKAAYLFNFGKFVKWPGTVISSQDTFPICILGEDPFGGALQSTVAGEQIEGKRVAVRQIETSSEALNCRILFISDSEQRRLSSVLATLEHAPVLTVSDMDDFADRRGMIQFVLDHDRVRFEVNLSAAEKAGLALSSDLLKVATAVKREGQPGR